MRALIQRVKEASVSISGVDVGHIHTGLLVLLGIEDSDTDEDIQWLCGKITRMRIFDDDQGVMNLPLTDIDNTNILLVSQFTLMASTRRGNRPSYVRAARPEIALPIYQQTEQCLSQLLGHPIATGQFGADMQVSLINDGPVTIWLDSKVKE
ncbi:MAG: D-tyrosyl-tRNA(Tyr) deacylase [Bacteroidales bacterium]|nr:D-tyrosyl-tRNA(Tyr) deacylase [Bacteroidales bacterium]